MNKLEVVTEIVVSAVLLILVIAAFLLGRTTVKTNHCSGLVEQEYELKNGGSLVISQPSSCE